MSDTKVLTPQKAQEYWQRTKNLMWVVLVIWFLSGFVVHAFAPALNQIRILGFPMGFYMAAQGSLIIFVWLIFWYVIRQNRIDDEFGVSED